MCILYSSVRTVMDLITLPDFLFLSHSRGFPVRHTSLLWSKEEKSKRAIRIWKRAKNEWAKEQIPNPAVQSSTIQYAVLHHSQCSHPPFTMRSSTIHYSVLHHSLLGPPPFTMRSSKIQYVILPHSIFCPPTFTMLSSTIHYSVLHNSLCGPLPFTTWSSAIHYSVLHNSLCDTLPFTILSSTIYYALYAILHNSQCAPWLFELSKFLPQLNASLGNKSLVYSYIKYDEE